MKIFDCFTFSNELDLLELRLRELYNYIDTFVIVEGNTSFTNINKPYVFEENKDRFKPFLDKIIYVKANMPNNADAWQNEKFQRDCIKEGLIDATDNDVVIISDLDEILRASAVRSMRNDTDVNVWALRMPVFYFKFNYLMYHNKDSNYSTWGIGIRFKYLESADELRKNRFYLNSFPFNYIGNNIRLVEHAGWHFSYLGNEKFAIEKIKSFSHTETNTPEIINNLDIERSIKNGEGLGHSETEKFIAVNIDDYLPKEIINNPKKYSSYLIETSGHSAREFLPVFLP